MKLLGNGYDAWRTDTSEYEKRFDAPEEAESNGEYRGVCPIEDPLPLLRWQGLEVEDISGLTEAERLQKRQGSFGCSDVPCLLNSDPYKTLTELILTKRGAIPVSTVQSEAAFWGTKAEDLYLPVYADRRDVWLHRPRIVLRNPDFPLLTNTPDALAVENIIGGDDNEEAIVFQVEGKCINAFDGQKLLSSGEIRDRDLIQCQAQMAVTGHKFLELVYFIGGNNLQWFRVERDDRIIKIIKAEVEKAWALVNSNQIPELTSRDVDLMSDLYPRDNGNEVDMSRDTGMKDLLVDLGYANEKLADAEEEVNKLKAQVKKLIGENQRVICDRWQVIWANTNTTSLDTKKLKTEMPDIYERFARTATTRRFTIKERRQENGNDTE